MNAWIPDHDTIGILGGGQLARMLALAGAPLGVRFLVVDSVADACAGQVAPLLRADWRDFAALDEFAARVDVATFDFENVPAETAQWLTEHARVSRIRARWRWRRTGSRKKPCSANSACRHAGFRAGRQPRRPGTRAARASARRRS